MLLYQDNVTDMMIDSFFLTTCQVDSEWNLEIGNLEILQPVRDEKNDTASPRPNKHFKEPKGS